MKHFISRGFTFIELMITVFIASIMIGLALPSLTSMFNEIRLSSVQQRLISDMTFARSEAINIGGGIAMCPSTNNTTCSTTTTTTTSSISSIGILGICSGSSCSNPTNTDWSQGWIIFVDNNSNGVLNSATDELLRVSDVTSMVTITSDHVDTISFSGEGIANVSGNFKICDARGDTSVSKGFDVALSGRIRPSTSVTCP